MSDWIGFEEALAILTEGVPPERWADGRPLPKRGEPWPDDWPDDRQFRRGAVTLFLQDEAVRGNCRVMGRRNSSAVHEEVPPVKMRSLEILSTVGKPVPPSGVPEAILMPPEHTMEERDTDWRKDIYRQVRFIRDEIEKLRPKFQKWVLADGEVSKQATIAGEAACKRWLCKLMREVDSPGQSKGQYEEEAKQQFAVSGRGFDRAWSEAIRDTGASRWSAPGPRNRRGDSNRQ